MSSTGRELTSMSIGQEIDCGCLASAFLQHQGPHRQVHQHQSVIDDVMLVAVWSCSCATDTKGNPLPEVPASCSENVIALASPTPHTQWRHCLIVQPGIAQCWGYCPDFDDHAD